MDIKKTINKATTLAIGTSFPYISTILTPFLSEHPYWNIIFYSAIGLYSIYFAVNQEELNEIIEFIKEHPAEFREDIVKSKEFRKGFLLFTDQYIKQRIEEKKVILKKIILGYAISNEETAQYDLERLNDCIMRISLNALKYSLFLKKKIIPSLEADIENEITGETYQDTGRDHDWWKKEKALSDYPLSKYLDSWIISNYSPGEHKIKQKFLGTESNWTHPLLQRAYTDLRDQKRIAMECLTELTSFGILRTSSKEQYKDNELKIDYFLTEFGTIFFSLIDK